MRLSTIGTRSVPVRSSSDYPIGALTRSLSKRLFSRDGEEGIAALVERLRSRWGALVAAWDDRKADGGAGTLGAALHGAAKAVDRSDLRAFDIPLRTYFAGFVAAPDFEINVGSKIVHSIIEVLANNSEEQVVDAVVNIASSITSPTAYDPAFLANLILVEVYLKHAEFDQAIAAARANINVSCCATSQYMLYKSLRAKKQAGLRVDDSEICNDDLSNHFCHQPFTTIASGTGGRYPGAPPSFYACSCPVSVPYPVTDAASDQTVEAIWNGPEIQEIRRSILDGDFKYCSRRMCPDIVQGKLPKRDAITDPHMRDIIDNRRTALDSRPTMVTLGHDPSCNLACPSCRCEILTIKNEARERLDRVSERVLLPLIEDTPVSLIICTDGDPFSSKHYRRLIHSLDPRRHAQTRLMLITNGLLFTHREWESLGEVQKLFAFVGVSIDGARATTYEDLRRPGKWSTITENMEFMSELRRDGKLPMLGLQFVVQKKNFEEMVEFVELGKKWGVDLIRFIRLINLGSYTGQEFHENDVSDPRHPLHDRFLQVLRNPVFKEPPVDMFTLGPLYDLYTGPLGELETYGAATETLPLSASDGRPSA